MMLGCRGTYKGPLKAKIKKGKGIKLYFVEEGRHPNETLALSHLSLTEMEIEQ